MAKKNKKVVAAPEVKPFVVTLNPLNINQPVDICQSFNSVSTAWEEPVEEPKPIVHKCSVKKAQRFFGILALLVIAAVAVFALVVNPAFTNNMVGVWSVQTVELWKTGDWIVFGGLYVGAVVCVSILVRWFLHSIGCKAKRRNKRCCRKCEFYKFAWTEVILFIGAFVGLAYGFAANNFLGFTGLYNKVITVINALLANGFNLAALSPFDLKVAYGIAGVGAIIVLLVIFSLGHKVVDKRRAKYSA